MNASQVKFYFRSGKQAVKRCRTYQTLLRIRMLIYVVSFPNKENSSGEVLTYLKRFLPSNFYAQGKKKNQLIKQRATEGPHKICFLNSRCFKQDACRTHFLLSSWTESYFQAWLHNILKQPTHIHCTSFSPWPTYPASHPFGGSLGSNLMLNVWIILRAFTAH